MGISYSKSENVKHVLFDNLYLSKSSKEFIEMRKKYDLGEYKSQKDADNLDKYELLSPTEREIIVHIKRTTFLEPPTVNHNIPKDVFRQQSMQNEMNEFTYAKSLLEAKKHHRLIRLDNSENKLRNREESVKRTKKKSNKRNLSHDPLKKA